MFWKKSSCDTPTWKLLQSLGENRARVLAPHTWRRGETARLPSHPLPTSPGGGFWGLPWGGGHKRRGKGRGDGGPAQLAEGRSPRCPPFHHPHHPHPGRALAPRAGRRSGREPERPNRHLVRLARQPSGEGARRAPAYLAREVRVRSGDAGRGRCQLLRAALQVSEARGSPSSPPPRAPRAPLLPPSPPAPARSSPCGRPPPRSPSPPAVYSGERWPLSRAFPPPARARTHLPQKRALFRTPRRRWSLKSWGWAISEEPF